MNLPDIAINNAYIVNEGEVFQGTILISQQKIIKIIRIPDIFHKGSIHTIDASGKFLIPGIIDDQVHFREPGLTHKANIYSESRAAVAGGITSYMEMPNTKPQTTTMKLLKDKLSIAAETSLANYSFYLGATNNNLHEISKADPKEICGIKVFMGSSTGNMLVNDPQALAEIFKNAPTIIAVHCEDDSIINKNLIRIRNKFNDNIPFRYHPVIRSVEACYKSSSMAVELAEKNNAHLHILHLSSGKELDLLKSDIPRTKKQITAEVCVHHLWFTDKDYDKQGAFIKWNPAIKSKSDKEKLIDGVNNNLIDIIATDHAPHTLEEKQNNYLNAPSGGPLVQHSLVAMLEHFHNNKIRLEQIVDKMCHAPADIFQIDRRGYIREGYWADLAIFNPNAPWTVKQNNILYKCKWSPFTGYTFTSQITHTMVNGKLVYENGVFHENEKGKQLIFNR